MADLGREQRPQILVDAAGGPAAYIAASAYYRNLANLYPEAFVFDITDVYKPMTVRVHDELWPDWI